MSLHVAEWLANNTFKACWGSGIDPPGDAAAPINFWVLWGTTASLTSSSPTPLLALKTHFLFLLFLLLLRLYCRLCMTILAEVLGQKTLEAFSDVIWEIYQQMACSTTFWVVGCSTALTLTSITFTLFLYWALSYLFLPGHIKTGCGWVIVPADECLWLSNFTWNFC